MDPSAPAPDDRELATRETLPLTPPSAPQAGSNAVPPEIQDAPASARFGKYVRIIQLGAGAMGEVWKAWDTELHRWVALKFLKSVDAEEVRRFTREAQIAGTLSHPNIAAIYDVGQDQGRHFLAMQFIQGTTLRSIPGNDRNHIARLIRDAARAVAFAHERGIIHRDLKPENLMVSVRLKPATGRFDPAVPRTHLYVTDFGLARVADGASSLSVPGTVVGTPAYMAPEQARAETLDGRADVYSLGATLYALLSGQPPFEAENLYDVLRRVQEEEPASLRSINPSIPAELELIVAKAMDKERDRRYATATDLADDLDRWLEGEPVAARPSSLIYRLTKGIAKRRAVVVTGTVGAALSLLLLAVLIPTLGSRQSQIVEQMRLISSASLDAALLLRRSGDIAGMNKYAEQIEESCRTVAAEIPTLAEPHYRLGRIYRAQMRNDKALAEQEKALARDPSYVPSLYERVLLTAGQVRELAFRVNQAANPGILTHQTFDEDAFLAPDAADPSSPPAEEAEKLMSRMQRDLEAMRQRPEGLSAGEVLFAQGRLCWVEGRVDDAVGLFLQAIEKSPDLSDVYEALAILEHDARNYEKAVRWWTEGITRDKGYVGLYDGRALSRFHWAITLGKRGPEWKALVDGALADASEVIRLFPQSTPGFVKRARIHALQAMESKGGPEGSAALEAAYADAAVALNRDPLLSEAWQIQAAVLHLNVQILRGEGKPYESLLRQGGEAYEKAIALSSFPGPLQIAHAQACLAEGECLRHGGLDPVEWYRRGIPPLDHFIEKVPDYRQARTLRGELWMRTGNALRDRSQPAEDCYANALRDFDALLRQSPDALELHMFRATIRWNWMVLRIRAGGPIDELFRAAKADADKVIAGNPGNMRIRALLGKIYIARGQDELRNSRDPEPWFERADESLGQAIASGAKDRAMWLSDRGTLMAEWAGHAVGRDPSRAIGLYRRTIDDAGEATKLAPAQVQGWVMLGLANQKLAMLIGSRAEGTRKLMEQAIEAETRALELNPSLAHVFFDRALSHSCLAAYPQGADSRRAQLQAGLEDLASGVRLDPSGEAKYATLRAQIEKLLKAGETKEF